MKDPKRMTVLLTDDDEDDRDFFQYAIDDLEINSNLLLFNSGAETIAYLDNDNDIPDILFLDLNMPIMSGFQCLEKIRADVRFRKIPFIAIYSTSSSDADKKKSLQYGANAYITKPSDFSDLKDVLRRVLMTDWQAKGQPASLDAFVIR